MGFPNHILDGPWLLCFLLPRVGHTLSEYLLSFLLGVWQPELENGHRKCDTGNPYSRKGVTLSTTPRRIQKLTAMIGNILEAEACAPEQAQHLAGNINPLQSGGLRQGLALRARTCAWLLHKVTRGRRSRLVGGPLHRARRDAKHTAQFHSFQAYSQKE